jgi:hypothetical protein
MATLLELGHERTHRPEVELLERGIRKRVGQESPGPFDELHVFFARAELHPVALRPGDGIRRLYPR